jgi:O-antigen ligase
MKRGPRRPSQRSIEPLLDWMLRAPLIAGAILIPLVISHGLDVFRYPKELLFRGEAILAIAAVAIFFVMAPDVVKRRLATIRVELAIAAAAVGWTAIAAAFSTNRAISIESLAFVTTAACVFVATAIAARTWRGGAAVVILIPAMISAVVLLLQRFEIWSPMVFEPGTPLRLRITAMIGNPNDLGCYLIAPLLLSVALALVERGRPRAFYACAAILVGIAMMATETLTAIGSTGVGLFLMAMLTWRRASLRVIAIAAVALVLLFAAVTPLRNRARLIASQARAGEISLLTSNRIPPFLTAWAIFKDHPLIGTGPGTFHFWYMPYKVQLNQRYPRLTDTVVDNYGQVHNDHLELLATAGIPAYAIFLVALVRLGSISFTGGGEEPENRYQAAARRCALPLSAAVFVMTLAQFPLELAATLSVLIHTSALCVARRTQ